MKRLSISLASACFMLLLSAYTYFSPVPAMRARTIHAASAAEKKQASFYWFSYPDDIYNDYATVSDESWELWVYYGAYVSTNPSGGVLISRGYTTSASPHITLPVQWLYIHY